MRPLRNSDDLQWHALPLQGAGRELLRPPPNAYTPKHVFLDRCACVPLVTRSAMQRPLLPALAGLLLLPCGIPRRLSTGSSGLQSAADCTVSERSGLDICKFPLVGAPATEAPSEGSSLNPKP